MWSFRHLPLSLGLGLALTIATPYLAASAEEEVTKKAPLAFGPDQVIIDFNKMEWSLLELEGFPTGAEYSLLRGDFKHGVELIVRVPPGYQVPNHNHTSDETIIWLKGDFTYINGADGRSVGMSGQAFASLPGNATPHSVRCGNDPCLFYLRFSRAFDYKIFPMPETATKMN